MGTEKSRNLPAGRLAGAAQEKRTGPLASSALRHLSGSLRGRARNSVGRPALGTLWGAAGERPARGEPAALPAEPPATTCREVSRSKLTLEADIFAAGGPGSRDAGASSSEGRCQWRPGRVGPRSGCAAKGQLKTAAVRAQARLEVAGGRRGVRTCSPLPGLPFQGRWRWGALIGEGGRSPGLSS